jgi:hypothetical protein
MKKLKFNNILIFILFITISIIFTFPLILHLKDKLPGWEMDSLNYLWNIDTFWFELFKGNNPFFTQRIFYPLGTNLLFHTYAPFISLLGLFFLNKLVLYINLLILISLGLAAFNTFLLTHYLTKNYIASVIAGLFYGFCPIMISYIWSQHYYFLFASSLMPLGILFLIKLLSEGKKLLSLIIIFWIMFFIDYYTTIIFLILCLVVAISFLLKKNNNFIEIFRKNTFKYLKIILLSLIIPGSVYLFIFTKTSRNYPNISQPNNFYPGYCNANLLGYVTPSHFNPVLKNFNQLINKKYDFNLNYDTPSYFLGWITLLVLIYLIIKNRKNWAVITFIIYGLIIFLLSFGLNLKIGKAIYYSNYLPFNFFNKLPFMNLVDCPLRFPVGINLAISVILALGISKYLMNKRTKHKLFTVFIFIIIFFIEYGSHNMPIHSLEIPSVYKVVKESSNQKSVLELPSGITESKGGFGYDWSINALHLKQLYWQIYYKKPRVGGYTSRLSSYQYDYYKTTPVISDLFQMTNLNGKWPNKIFGDLEIKDFINKFNIGFVVLSPNSRQKYFSEVVENIFKEEIDSVIKEENYILYILKRD